MVKVTQLPAIGINTSEEFVQKLKGAHDPIPLHHNSPSSSSLPSVIPKIQVANLAWQLSRSDNPSASRVQIPQLSSVLFDWLLDALSVAAKAATKTKVASPSTWVSPLYDPDYYQLLESLLSESEVHGVTTPLHAHTATRNRPHSILSISSALLKCNDVHVLAACLPVAAKPLSRLLTPALPALLANQSSRQSIDEILKYACELISELDIATQEHEATLRGLARLVQTIGGPLIDAYKEAASFFSWKSHQYFLLEILLPWAGAIEQLSRCSTKSQKGSAAALRAASSLRRTLYAYGQSILFSTSTTKLILFPSPTMHAGNAAQLSLLPRLQQLVDIGKIEVLATLPLLVASAIRALQTQYDEISQVTRARHKKKMTELLGNMTSTETQSNEFLNRDQTRQETDLALFQQFISPMLELADAAKTTHISESAHSRCAMLQALFDANFGTTLRSDQRWQTPLVFTVQSILSDLKRLQHPPSLLPCISALHSLWKIDQDILRQHLAQLFGTVCAHVRTDDSSKELDTAFQAFSGDILTAFARSQEIPTLVCLLSEQMASEGAVPRQLILGMGSQQFAAALSASVAANVSPTHIVYLLEDQTARLETLFIASQEELASCEQTTKRKADDLADVVAGPISIRLSNALWISQHVLSALRIPAAMASDAIPLLVRIQTILGGIISAGPSASACVSPTVPAKKARKSSDNRSLESAVGLDQDRLQLVASSLRCWYGLCTNLKRLDQAIGSAKLTQVNNSLEHLNSCSPSLLTYLTQSRLSDGQVSERTDGANLLIEVARLLLFRKEVELETRALDAALNAPQELETFWRLILAALRGEGEGASAQTALWEILLRRWTLVINASPPTNDLLAQMSLLLIQTLPSSTQAPSEMHEISIALSRNADFLELKEWRRELMGQVEALTADKISQRRTLQVFAGLAAFPTQYIPGEFRELFVKRAIKAAFAEGGVDPESIEDAKAVWTWLARLARSTTRLTRSMAEIVSSACLSLGKTSRDDSVQVQEMLTRVWLAKLIECQQLSPSELQALITGLERSPFGNILLETFIASGGSSVAKQVTFSANATSLLASSPSAVWRSPIAAFPGARLALSLAKLQDDGTNGQLARTYTWAVTLFDHDAQKAFLADSSCADITFAEEYLALAAVCFETGDGGSTSRLGRRVFQTLATVLAFGGNGATKIAFGHIEQVFHRASSHLSTEEYEETLKLLIGMLDASHSNGAGARSLLTTLGLLLNYGPEGTLLVAQKQFTRLVSRLQHRVLRGDTQVVLGALHALHLVCEGRAIILRATDASLLLPLLSSILSEQRQQQRSRDQGDVQSSPTSPATSIEDARAIYSLTVGIVAAAIRLRKELLLPLMPHLAIILGQLPPLFRKPAPVLSNGQRVKLLRSMPFWLAKAWSVREDWSEDHAADGGTWRDLLEADGTATQQEGAEVLGESHARDFSRLLESITSKTTSRSRRGGGDLTASHPSNSIVGNNGAGGKVDSLSRPFSKHAVYVLLAYIRTLLDDGGNNSTDNNNNGGGGEPGDDASYSYSHLDRRVKRELLVGLANLCAIIDERERDWILVGDLLDEAGKSVFKEIWRTWDRARYKGV